MSDTNPVRRLLTNKPPGLRPRINAMCATCVGCTAELQGNNLKDYMPDGWRKEITNCPVTTCPLHDVRPYQEEREDA